jgi:colanic acid biosynthesis glycosyl transferase WcaI
VSTDADALRAAAVSDAGEVAGADVDVVRARRQLRIGVHDFSGHPFQVQLSRSLAGRGHDVRHWHCPAFLTGKGSLEVQPGDPATLSIEPVPLERSFSKYSKVRRYRDERTYGKAISDAVLEFGPDVIISSNTPLIAQQRLVKACNRAGIPFVFWQQDIYSVAMRRIATDRYGRWGSGMGRMFEQMEGSMLRKSAAVVVISDDFLPVLAGWGVDEDKIAVVENWAPLGEIDELPRRNAWSDRHGLSDRRVVLYSGTLGLKHNPGMLLELAERFQGTDVMVVVVSAGPIADHLASLAQERGVDNLMLLPFQPFEELPQVFASADVLVAILEMDAGIYSVPSKILSYHCAGRPILAAVPPSNLAARIVGEAQSGVVVDPTSSSEFVLAAERLLDDPQMREGMGRSARAYAERVFDIDTIADRFESVMDGAVRRLSVA